MEEKEVDKTQEEVKAATETPKGRDGVLAKYRNANPDTEGEPTEEELWAFAGEDYDNLKGTHNKVMEGQKGLYDYVAKDPRFGAAIGMSFGEGEDKIPFMQALGRVYGKDAFEDSEEFMKGAEEFNKKYNDTQAEQKKAQENFANLTIPRLEQFAKENNLSDEQVGEIGTGLVALGEGMLMGDIPLELIDMIYKGLNYDKDIQDAADTGFVEGKNQNIELKKKNMTSDSPIPDLGNATGAGKNKPRIKKDHKSYYDDMEVVK